MAWTETFHCDVCSKEKKEGSTDWWLAWPEKFTPPDGEKEHTAMKVTPWNNFLAHSAEIQHLCGARCVHTVMDRWMMRQD